MSYSNFEKKINELGDLGDRMMQGMPYNQGGAVTGASSYGTYSSPDVSQNADKFGTFIDKSKLTADSGESLDKVAPYGPYSEESPEDYEDDVDQVKYKVTPDEVLCGIDYEMKKMVLKDKQVAKQNVVSNLKDDPQYYSKLKMLGIDDVDEENATEEEEDTNVNDGGTDYELNETHGGEKYEAMQDSDGEWGVYEPSQHGTMALVKKCDSREEAVQKADKMNSHEKNESLDEFYTPQEREIRSVMREMYKNRFNR